LVPLVASIRGPAVEPAERHKLPMNLYIVVQLDIPSKWPPPCYIPAT